VTLPDTMASLQVHQWAVRLWRHDSNALRELWPGLLYVSGFAVAALASLGLLMRFKHNFLEEACDTTLQLADHRRRLREGLHARTAAASCANSLALPRWSLFQGVGAVLWKNVVAARRSRREMRIAGLFVLAYTGFFTALLWIYHDLGRKAGGVPLYEARAFT